MRCNRKSPSLFSVLAVGTFVGLAAQAHAGFYTQTDLVTDNNSVLTGLGYTAAPTVDPNLVNPWGISHSGTSPFWVSDNGTGVATLYSSTGSKLGLTVTIPPPSTAPAGTTSTPTGQVFNNTTGFVLPGGAVANFIFATEDGTISAWNGAQGTTAVLRVDNTLGSAGPVYKGLAIGTSAAGPTLYAANFRNGTVDMFNSSFAPIGSFTDLTVPAGYAPFNVENLGGHLFVTFALQNAAKHDDVAGPGHGFVDEFNLDGSFVRRVASNGPLNSPWGLDIAPAAFGAFSNDLLVGNFGDGTIDAFDPVTAAFLGALTDASGNLISIDGLWALINGNGGNGGDPNTVYFSAGINGEADGLLGALTVPEPGTLTIFGAGILGLIVLLRRRQPGFG